MSAAVLRLSAKKFSRLFVAAALTSTIGLHVVLYRNGSRQATVQFGQFSARTDHGQVAWSDGEHSVRTILSSSQSRLQLQSGEEMLKSAQEEIAISGIETAPARSRMACSEANGLQDIVYVIKTGATEAMEKLPVHFDTTMKCFPNVLIFSDYAETMDGHIIHDALDSITEDIRLNNEDFELWRRLHQGGRSTLRPEEMSDHRQVVDASTGAGQSDNGGWRLDKFKNIPMIGKTLALSRPETKWFIYTDADTFISWANLLHYTSLLDYNQPLYMGSQAQVSDQIFAHGGSGYLLSRTAMVQVAELYDRNQEEWDRYAASHSFGDAVLATALEKELNIRCTWAFPSIQGGDPSLQDFSLFMYERRLWCYPAISYHHLTPATIRSLWKFEQDFHRSGEIDPEPMRHSHVFKQWLMPQMRESKQDWDNGAVTVVMTGDGDQAWQVHDLPSCQSYCLETDCFQYSFIDDVCRTSLVYPRLGNKPTLGAYSGWNFDAIEAWANELDGKCDSQGEWIIS